MNGDHIDGVAGELPAVARSRHRELRDEVILANVESALFHAQIRRRRKLLGDQRSRRLAADCRLGTFPVKMEDGVLGVQGDDRIRIALAPFLRVPNR